MGWEVAILGATKKQQQSLHKFFGRMASHKEEVANIPFHHADTIIAIAKELACNEKEEGSDLAIKK
jgi:hypothetical protein